MCHVWPSISPFNVWDLPLRQWAMFARAADDWVRNRQQQQEG